MTAFVLHRHWWSQEMKLTNASGLLKKAWMHQCY